MTILEMDIHALDRQARQDAGAFRAVSREVCLSVVREYVQQQRLEIQALHRAGASGSVTLHRLADLCDEIVRISVSFGLAHIANPNRLMQRVAVCALGGYGRREMSPHSDLDVSLVFDSALDVDIEALNTFLLPFFWDLGFQAGYTLHSVNEAAALARTDPRVFTTYSQARLIQGDCTTFGRLKLKIGDLESSNREAVLTSVRCRERPEMLAPVHRDLYALEPDIKESAGGLRDFHAALWMILLTHGVISLDELAQMEQITPVEHIEFLDGLDFIWRIRNELHFHSNREENRLTFALQKHVAHAFGYGHSAQAVARFMEDYYNAACQVRKFLHVAARICEQPEMTSLFEEPSPGRSKFTVYQQQLCVDPSDKNWFAEKPSRLMEVIWESARRAVPLSLATTHWLRANVPLVNDAFRTSNAVRRYFLGICNRPLQAGTALRQAANTGLLGAYLPEFHAIRGMVRYEDFHSYPVDEHTLRALEALARLPVQTTTVTAMMYRVLERIRDPHVLVLGILLHDLGKVAGEVHAEVGVSIARTIAERTGLNEYDTERILKLVQHHMVMSDIAFYRDTDDLNVVAGFIKTVKTDDMLRMLLLLTYADLSAVAPGVWTEWKGALLAKLFFKAERMLTGRGEKGFDRSRIQPKLDRVRACAVKFPEQEVDRYLNTLSERYLVAYEPEQIVAHMQCMWEAYEKRLAIQCMEKTEMRASEIVVCTRDRHGLFAQITGAFSSQLVNIRSAALFTRDDGWVMDCFLVDHAVHARPLTVGEVESVHRTLQCVVLEEGDIRGYVDASRRRLFAMTQHVAAVKPSVEFDNDASRTDTVIDIVAGDRIGLLYDIAHTLSDMGIDFQAAHIVTDVGRARDAFYVRMNGHKLEEEKLKAWVSQRLHDAVAGGASHGKT